jgi:hypothetical protein
MTQGLSRHSAEIIPFPGRRRVPAYGTDMQALEADAAKYRSAVDTTGWYHDDAIEEDVDHLPPSHWRA